jgi:small acid-soluble spore protein I (minor)
MNVDLRQAIIQRVQGKTNEELHEVIQDSVDGEERALPGLGVLFELIWKNSEQQLQDTLVTHLKEGLAT